MAPSRFEVGDVVLGPGSPLFLIAGPCVVEDEATVLRIARRAAAICAARGVPYIFKASYDKANRTSVSSYRGPGMEEGLRVLQEVKRQTGRPVLTDVHLPSECAPTAEVADVLQVPAFLCRQTDLVLAAAATGRAVNVKKGQFMAPWDMRSVVGKLEAGGCRRYLLTERGASFGYNNLVSDMRSIPIMQALGCPVVFDGTHSVQLPGGQGETSGGSPEFIPTLVRCAVAAGCDGLFLEVHEDPARSRSDAANALHLDRLDGLLSQVTRIREALGAGS
ncbi:MAG: 3-deoxy-8-phosphooctulonate synthase [Planctomycetes bacterium]|nr:3-deoxy-8-phosphooctulonate synthase [Planctomycetota bacterium]